MMDDKVELGGEPNDRPSHRGDESLKKIVVNRCEDCNTTFLARVNGNGQGPTICAGCDDQYHRNGHNGNGSL